MTATGWYLLFPTDRSLRRVHVHHVLGFLRDNRHRVALRCATTVQQRQGDDRAPALGVLPLLLVRRRAATHNGEDSSYR